MLSGAPLRLLATASLVAGLAACGGTSAAKGSIAPSGSATQPSDNVGDTSGKSEVPAGPLSYAAPDDRPCMLHQQAGGYYTCLSGADGQCFHYGAVCEPTDVCVPDLTSGELKICENFTEGRCDMFGKSCEPKSTCVYDAKERRYRTCPTRKSGRCTEFGAPCTPD